MLKEADFPYEINIRSHNWPKVINYDYTEVLITGYTKKDIKFLILSRWNCSWIYGIHANAKRSKFHSMKQVKSESDEYVFNELILCKVKHRFKTKHGKIRMPSFKSWRV